MRNNCFVPGEKIGMQVENEETDFRRQFHVRKSLETLAGVCHVRNLFGANVFRCVHKSTSHWEYIDTCSCKNRRNAIWEYRE